MSVASDYMKGDYFSNVNITEVSGGFPFQSGALISPPVIR